MSYKNQRFCYYLPHTIKTNEKSCSGLESIGIGEFDAQGNMTGIYPHYVIRTNANDPSIKESDGGITLGYGYWVNQAKYNSDATAKALIDTYCLGAPFLPSNTSTTHKVPNSLPMPIGEARELLRNTLPSYENAVNAFLSLCGVQVKQHQFDVLVSFTYNFGANTWTRSDRSEWNINKLIRNGHPFIPGDKDTPGTVRHAFGGFTQNKYRRATEAEIFINGH